MLIYNAAMKKIFAATALSLVPFGMATEEAMNQALSNWNQQVTAYDEAIRNAPSEELKASITAPNGRDIAPQLWQSLNGRTGTRENPRGKGRIPTYEFEKSWALPGIVWILEHPQAFTAAFTEDEQAQLTYFGEAIVESIGRVHFNNPKVGEVCPSLSATSSVREYELLQKIYQRNQHKPARAAAALGMSLMLNNPMVSSIEGSTSMARAKRLYYLKQSILLADKDTRFGSQPLTEVAMEQAYFLRHLAVGCVAPLVKVKDPQGVSHSFPTPGQLTLLLFWSPADPVSTNMLRDIDKLKAQYPGLVVCPIMPHAEPEEQQKALTDLGIAHSYVDDAKGSVGHTYRIGQLPSTILISKRCHILYAGAPDMKLQTALETATADEQAAAKANRPKVMTKGADEPVIQPGSTPRPTGESSIPELREMPEF